jgi:hypothetical protein
MDWEEKLGKEEEKGRRSFRRGREIRKWCRRKGIKGEKIGKGGQRNGKKEGGGA